MLHAMSADKLFRTFRKNVVSSSSGWSSPRRIPNTAWSFNQSDCLNLESGWLLEPWITLFQGAMTAWTLNHFDSKFKQSLSGKGQSVTLDSKRHAVAVIQGSSSQSDWLNHESEWLLYPWIMVIDWSLEWLLYPWIRVTAWSFDPEWLLYPWIRATAWSFDLEWLLYPWIMVTARSFNLEWLLYPWISVTAWSLI
jgi:hypothetical protein